MKHSRYYAAYGSNLNLEQMRHRCPTARVVGVSSLENHHLLFRGSPYNAVATVEPCENSSVPVLIWEITPRDEKALDIYEGAPRFYRQEILDFEVNGKSVEAMMYVMNDGHSYGIPSNYYLNVIREGYKSAGFDERILMDAVHESLEHAMNSPISQVSFYDDFS